MQDFYSFIMKAYSDNKAFNFEQWFNLPGARAIYWAYEHMPVLNRFASEENQFKGKKISIVIHMEAKSAVLALYLAAAGAEVCVAPSNPLSTKDEIITALKALGLKAYGSYNEDMDTYNSHIKEARDFNPDFIIDDGGDLLNSFVAGIEEGKVYTTKGGAEETTTGVHNINKLAKAGKLPFSMVATNDCIAKNIFDNTYGSLQSGLAGILSLTNLQIPSSKVVVAGYGRVGEGVAKSMKALGAEVIITEIAPIPALKAKLEGFSVMPMAEAIKIGDLFITATGCCDVITTDHLLYAKDNAVFCNIGHFDNEIDVAGLQTLTGDKGFSIREGLTQYILNVKVSTTDPNNPDDVTEKILQKRINILADGRLVNLAGNNLGHPVETMDISFSAQYLALLILQANEEKLTDIKDVILLQDSISESICATKLSTLGVKLDLLTDKQKQYLGA